MAKDRRFELRIASDLLDRVDAKRGDASRAAFITSALERALTDSPDVGRRSAMVERRPEQPATAVIASAPVRAPDDLNAELAAIRARKGLSLPDRIELEGEARRRWGSR